MPILDNYYLLGVISALGFIVASASVFLTSIIRYRSLSHIPGPFLAKFTNLWLGVKIWTKTTPIDLQLDLHERYGPIVRYGPNRVLFSDASAVPTIFSTKHPLRKAESYEIAFQVVNGKLISSFTTTRDEARISAMKKHIISAFTTSAIVDYEHHVDRNILSLIDHLSKAGEEVNIAQWNSFFTFDTICRIAFSEDEGLVEKQEDLGNILKAARDRFSHWHYWQAFPKLERLIFKNRFAARAAGTSPLAQIASEKVQLRLKEGGLGSHQDLLDRYLQAGEKAPQLFSPSTVVGLVISTIHAGSETTATTLTIILYHLLRRPDVVDSLLKELQGAGLSSPPSWDSVRNLRYLDAVIKEAARLNPVSIGMFERDVPEGGLEIAGTYIPGGTVVTLNTHALKRDPSIWGNDFKLFRPERWLEATEEQLAKMERSNLYFSAGRRMCIGQHIALFEMKKYLAELLNRFDITLKYPDQKLNSDATNFQLAIPELLVNITPRL